MKEYEVSFKVKSEAVWRDFEDNVKVLSTWQSPDLTSVGYEIWVPADAEIKDVTPRQIQAGDTVKEHRLAGSGTNWRVEHRSGDWLWLFKSNSNSGELRNVDQFTLVED